MGERRKEEPKAPPGMKWLIVTFILTVALGVRLLYLAEIRDHALFAALTGDPAVYEAQARDILRGIMVPDHAYFHSSPLYPFFLAAVMKLAGSGFQAVRIVQACVGCVSVFLVYLLSRLTVGPRPAVVASALAALYVPFIFFEAEFLEITLVVAFLAGALVLLQRAAAALGTPEAPRGETVSARATGASAVWLSVAAGALLGLAALGKPNLLLLAPAGAVWLAVRSGFPRRRRTGDRTGLLAPTLFFVVCGITILPATVHNYRAEGDLIPVSSNAGINLYIGNHPGAPGTFTVPTEMRFDLRTASRDAARQATGRDLSAGEVSNYWAGRALAFIRQRPAMWLEQTARKFALFWNHYEIPNHYDLSFVAESAPVLRIPLGTFAVVAPLGIVGLVLASVRKKNVGLLVVFAVAFMCSVVPFFITGRYRLPVVLALLPGAGYAVSELGAALASRRWRAVAAVAAPAAVLALLVNVDLIEFSGAQMHNTMGAILAGRGDLQSAAVEFETALEENPGDVSARRNLGLTYLELGRYGDAKRELERAVAIHPRYIEAWLELGRAYAGLDSLSAAREAWARVLSMNPPPAIGAEAERLLADQEAHTEQRSERPDADRPAGETR